MEEQTKFYLTRTIITTTTDSLVLIGKSPCRTTDITWKLMLVTPVTAELVKRIIFVTEERIRVD